MNPPKYVIAYIGSKYRILKFRHAGYYESIAEGNVFADAEAIVNALNGAPA